MVMCGIQHEETLTGGRIEPSGFPPDVVDRVVEAFDGDGIVSDGAERAAVEPVLRQSAVAVPDPIRAVVSDNTVDAVGAELIVLPPPCCSPPLCGYQ